MSERTILAEPRDGILVITLNRPHAYNSFDRRQSDALEAVIDGFEDDETLRCAVITGAGGRFCAGTDLKAAAAGERIDLGSRGSYGMLGSPAGQADRRRGRGSRDGWGLGAHHGVRPDGRRLERDLRAP